MRSLNSSQCELRFTTLRGFFYQLQSTADLAQPFTDDPAGFSQALDSSTARTNTVAGPMRFYRVVGALGL